MIQTDLGSLIRIPIILKERSLKARLHRRFLSWQLDAIFVAPKLHQVSNMFETPAISQRQIALRSHLVYTCDFEVATLSATKIASSCCDKTRLCKRALRYILISFLFFFATARYYLTLKLSLSFFPLIAVKCFGGQKL